MDSSLALAMFVGLGMGDEEMREILLYKSSVASNTCNPSWSHLSINFASPPELADCTCECDSLIGGF